MPAFEKAGMLEVGEIRRQERKPYVGRRDCRWQVWDVPGVCLSGAGCCYALIFIFAACHCFQLAFCELSSKDTYIHRLPGLPQAGRPPTSPALPCPCLLTLLPPHNCHAFCLFLSAKSPSPPPTHTWNNEK